MQKLPFVIRNVSDWCKTQDDRVICDMCNSVILENDGMLLFLPDCYKNQTIV